MAEVLSVRLDRFGLDPTQTLNNIFYARYDFCNCLVRSLTYEVIRAYTYEHQDALITMIAAKMVEERFALLVVDSITALFRASTHRRDYNANICID